MPRDTATMHYLEAGDQKARGGPGRGESFGAFRCTGDKAFLCPSWPFDFEISWEFWANPHITVIYIEPVFRREERRSSRPNKKVDFS